MRWEKAVLHVIVAAGGLALGPALGFFNLAGESHAICLVSEASRVLNRRIEVGHKLPHAPLAHPVPSLELTVRQLCSPPELLTCPSFLATWQSPAMA